MQSYIYTYPLSVILEKLCNEAMQQSLLTARMGLPGQDQGLTTSIVLRCLHQRSRVSFFKRLRTWRNKDVMLSSYIHERLAHSPNIVYGTCPESVLLAVMKVQDVNVQLFLSLVPHEQIEATPIHGGQRDAVGKACYNYSSRVSAYVRERYVFRRASAYSFMMKSIFHTCIQIWCGNSIPL